MMATMTGNDIGKMPSYFPEWAEWKERRREGWLYIGWIKNPTECRTPFKELCEKVRGTSNYGEIREVDIYPEGATCWVKKPEGK